MTTNQPPNQPKSLHVLSIDGGGIRGIFPALLLAEIESRTGKPICQLFDSIAGTSTGGILALGLSKPKSTAARSLPSQRRNLWACTKTRVGSYLFRMTTSTKQ